MRTRLLPMVVLFFVIASAASAHVGYYRSPALHGDTVVFAAEGDLWIVTTQGGVARRLTTHHGEETSPAISPDGTTLAFNAQYEGPNEVYTMPLTGGVPVRRTFDADRAGVVGWTPEGELLYTTRAYSTLPSLQLVTLDLATNERTLIPLAQASDGVFNDDGELFFARFRFQGSQTKRYIGGSARQLWKWAPSMEEAVKLTTDDPHEAIEPMWHHGRVYFLTDRDETMNIWSMKPDGSGLTQHTHYTGWDVKTPTLSGGRIIYQLGADLHVFDCAANHAMPLAITLASDFDQMRQRWVEKPTTWITSSALSPDGDRVVLTARGEVFIVHTKGGRIIQIDRDSSARYREGQFLPEGDEVLLLSDASGEIELWKGPADGNGATTQLTDDATVFRFGVHVSPDGKKIAYQDKDFALWVFDVETNEQILVAKNDWDHFSSYVWSPDSRWLAFVEIQPNQFRQIRLYNITERATTVLTTDRLNSYDPVFSHDGKWLYFLSDRDFKTMVGMPWGQYQPEPHLYEMTKLYALSLTGEKRSPFAREDEIQREEKAAEEKKKEDEKAEDEEDKKDDEAADETKDEDGEAEEVEEEEILELLLDDLNACLFPVPVPAGNYSSLAATETHLLWVARSTAPKRDTSIQSMKITNEKPEVVTVADGAGSFELSRDRKKMLVRKSGSLYVVDASGGKADLSKDAIDLSRWHFPFDPQEEWRQMFTEAWRLERDYFYAPNMHGVDWPAMLEKYTPLVDRVTSRSELSDLLAQMVGELSALHIFVVGGDLRRGPESVGQGALGAQLDRDVQAGGYRITRIFHTDPDYPDTRSPLAVPHLQLRDGDIITSINHSSTLDVYDIGMLLRDQVGVPVRLHIKPSDGSDERDMIVKPISTGAERNLRYADWEHSRRLRVEELSDGQIGYVHLRAMGGGNYLEFAKNFYPVFDRQALIIDVRHNSGGNIDSWILEKLMRRAWMHWQGRTGKPTTNMQYAFRGHMAVICNEFTASDGEAFAEGFRRLGLGTVFGTRTWGGGIWLSFSNFLVDRGIASAAEYGVFGPEGEWIIEGTGIEPDVTIDNLPHATFNGDDAQLRAVVEHLLNKLAEEPVPELVAPPWPDKSADDE